jgi:RNA polymerase sigma-70 factor (ECF subfamily)
MSRFQSRLDCDAFEQIVAFYIRPALVVARRILSDETLAEDAVQESFLKVIRKREQYIAGSPFSCWFYAIVRNVCLDMQRKRFRRKELLENAAASIERRKSRTEISGAPELLNLLASHERDVLVLRIVHGLGFRDVAAALGITEEAAKKRAQRALKRLRAETFDSQSSRDKSLAML